MKLKKLILIALLSLLTATQAWAQATIYENTFPDAESVDDWTLNGVTWSSANGNSLQFGNSSAYAIMPVLDADGMNLTITITATWINRVSLQTSPDGVNYTNKKYFTGLGSVSSSTSSQTMPDGTRYVKLSSSSSSLYPYLQSVKITTSCTEIVPASGVTLNKTATTIAVGATEQLTATVLEQKRNLEQQQRKCCHCECNRFGYRSDGSFRLTSHHYRHNPRWRHYRTMSSYDISRRYTC